MRCLPLGAAHVRRAGRRLRIRQRGLDRREGRRPGLRGQGRRDLRTQRQAHRSGRRPVPGPGRPTRRQFAAFATGAVVPYTQQTIDGIARLSPPQTVADSVDAMLAEAQSVNDRLKAQPAALAGTDDPFAKVGRLAKQAGLDGCAGD